MDTTIAGAPRTHPIPGSIIAATDRSEEATQAVAWAARQAELEGRALTVVTVTGAPRPSIPATPWSREIAAEGAERARRRHPGLEVASLAVEGSPATALVELSRTAHMVVLGSRRHGPTVSAMLGSVGSAVARYAACPVVVCRAHDAEPLHWGVAVGVDDETDPTGALAFAFRYADLHRRPLTVVHRRSESLLVAAGAPGTSPARPSAIRTLRDQFPAVHVTEEHPDDGLPNALRQLAAANELLVVERSSLDLLKRVDTTVAIVPAAR